VLLARAEAPTMATIFRLRPQRKPLKDVHSFPFPRGVLRQIAATPANLTITKAPRPLNARGAASSDRESKNESASDTSAIATNVLLLEIGKQS